MTKPRIIIADLDISYVVPLQLKFVEEFFGKVDMEIITDQEYFDGFFAVPQTADVLIISDVLYSSSLKKHNIANIFVMTEQYEKDSTGDLGINRIFKYTSIKEIMNEITSKSADALNIASSGKKESQIILVYSACGGVGKTTLAMGISACLTKNYKRVLYINAARLQTFHRMLENQSPITMTDVYRKLAHPSENIYNEIKHVTRQELFSYLPPFKASLMSLGLDYSIYGKIAAGAKRSSDYDYIIIDADASFGEEEARLIDLADRVLIVTKQSSGSVLATNLLVSNMNGAGSDKYVFVCNDFDKEQDNALISPDMSMKFMVSEYVDHFPCYDRLKPTDLSKAKSIQRTAFLII